MRGKFTGKMSNVIATVLFVIMAVITFVSTTVITLNETNNLKTVNNKAVTINTAWNPSEMGISSDEILRKGVEFANSNLQFNNGGCCQYTNDIISAVASSHCISTSLANGTWKTLGTEWENVSSVNGISMKNARVLSASDQMSGTRWYDVIGPENLKPGDIIVGQGHHMLYIGKAGSYDEICERLGITKVSRTSSGAGTYNSLYNTSESNTWGGQYWTLDVNGSGNVRISNYAWSSTRPEDWSKNLDYMRVYRFVTSTNGKFSMDIKKVDKETGSALPDATFHFEDRNDGQTFSSKKTTGSNGATTLINEKNINGEKHYIYAVKEDIAPTGYYQDVARFFGLDVGTGLDGTEYRVKNVRVFGADIEEKTINAGETKQYLTNGTWADGATVTGDTLFVISLDSSASNMGIHLTWANPPKHGKFSMNLSKVARAEGNESVNDASLVRLADAEFHFEERLSDIETIIHDSSVSREQPSIITDDEGAVSLVSNKSIPTGTATFKYSIMEKVAPEGTFNKFGRHFEIDVTTGADGDAFKAKSITLHGTNIDNKTINLTNSRQVWQYQSTSDVEGSWVESSVIGSNTLFVIDIPPMAEDINIALYWANPELKGAYHLNVAKRDARDCQNAASLLSKNTALAGAQFTLTQKVRTASGLSEAITKNVITSAGTDTKSIFGNTEITKYGIGNDKFDEYTITETAVPNGYATADLSNITVRVYKKEQSNKYIVDRVSILKNGTELGSASSLGDQVGTNIFDLNNDGVKDLGLEVSQDGAEIALTVINEPFGGYRMHVEKLDFETNAVLSGAEFSINQKVDDSETNAVAHTTGYSSKVVSNQNGPALVYWDNASNYTKKGDTSEIEIKNTGNDKYEISEVKAPSGYGVLNKAPITIQVNKGKKVDGIGYEIKSVEIVGIAGSRVDAPANINQTASIKIGYNGQVTTDANNYWFAIEFNKGDSGVIKVRFKDKKLKYTLDIDKVTKEDGVYLAGATFDVKLFKDKPFAYGTSEYFTLESLSTGGCKNVSDGNKVNPPIIVDADNRINQKDIIEIKETAAPDGYNISVPRIQLAIHKYNNGKFDVDNNGDLILNGVELLNHEGRSFETPAIINNNGELKVGLDAEGHAVPVNNDEIVKIILVNNKIHLTWSNPEIVGSYKAYLGKKDSDDLNGGYVSGISYEVTEKIYDKASAALVTKKDKEQIITETALSTIDGNIKINAANADEFIIKETDSESKGYELQPSEQEFRVIKEVNGESYRISCLVYRANRLERGNTYWILKDKTVLQQTANQPSDIQKKNAIGYIEVAENGTSFTYVGLNRRIKPLNFGLLKVNSADETERLSDTEMLVKRSEVADYTQIDISRPLSEQLSNYDDMTVIIDGALGSKNGARLDSIEKAKVHPNAYVYEIHEKNAAQGFTNGFYKKVNGALKEVAYVQVLIRENENREIVVDRQIIYTNDADSSTRIALGNLIDKCLVDTATRAVMLPMKNTPNGMYASIRKQKYGSDEKLANVRMTVKFDGQELSNEETSLFTSGDVRFAKDKLTVGEHTIEVYEDEATGNFYNVFDDFAGVDGIKVSFSIDENGKVSIINNGSNNFFPQSKEGVVKNDEIAAITEFVQVSTSTYNGQDSINIAVSNPATFKIELNKKLYNGESDVRTADKFNGKAGFVIKDYGTSNERFNGVLDTSTQATLISESKVKAESTFVYEIKETSVTGMNGEDNYQKDMLDKKLKLTVTVDKNGKICSPETGKTKLELDNSSDSEKLKKYIALDVDESENKVQVYVANMPKNHYSVELYKTDSNGKTITNLTATFNETIVRPSGTISAEGITTVNGVANLTDSKKLDTEFLVDNGASHTYVINEIKAPAGYIKLPGTIELTINFAASGSDKNIERAQVKYFSDYENRVEETVAGLRADVTDDPIVKIYVPNESKTFDFEMSKVDYEGNLITATYDNGVLDGTEFTVRRAEMRSNQDPTFPQSDDGQRASDVYDEMRANPVVINGLLLTGKVSDTIPLIGNTVYIYTVQENSSKSGYINILENKIMTVQVATKNKMEGDVIVPHIDNVSYNVVDPHTGRDITASFDGLVDAKISDNNPNKVELRITNPMGYKVRLNKTDVNDSPITSAVMDAYIGDKKYVSLNASVDGQGSSHISYTDSSAISDGIVINKGEQQVWKVYERATQAPYQNILGNNRYLEVKVKRSDTGALSINGNWTIKNSNGSNVSGSELTNIKKYISKVEFVKVDGVDVLDITFKNPTLVKFRITKYESDGETELPGATIYLNSDKVISGGSSYYETNFVAEQGTVKQYRITEEATSANHVNILAGKYINLEVITDARGNLAASYKIFENNGREISATDDIYSRVTLEPIVNDANGVPNIKIKILNPKIGKFGVKLFKVDENGNRITDYNADFAINKNGMISTQATVAGQITVDSNKEITSAGQVFAYQIDEAKAPVGYKTIDGQIYLNLRAKDNGDKLVLDMDNSTLNYNNNNVAISTQDGSFNANTPVAWYLDTSSSEPVIKIYVKNEQKEFDLALRKSIQTVTNDQGKTTYDRGPKLDVFSLARLRARNTAGYYHTKEAVLVETGDTVKYRINVFNEANLKGYAMEITDYLQSGLEFAANSEINTMYGWKFYDENGNETNNMSQAKYARTEYLKNSLLNECQLAEWLSGAATTSWSDYVEIECKVVEKPRDEQVYLTDRAEITVDKAVEILTDKSEVEVDINDRDSTPNDVKRYHNDEMYDYDSSVDYDNETFYPGYQDDDDKETVTINPKKEYRFVLNKVDEDNTPMDGANFTVEEQVDGAFTTVFNGGVNKSVALNEPDASGEDTVKVNKTYTYKITENSARAGYENYLANKYIIAKTYMNENNQMVIGEYGNDDVNSYFNRYGFIIYEKHENSADTIVSSSETDLYSRIGITAINTVNPPKINIVIPNEKIILGQYRVVLNKVDENNNPVANVPFDITNASGTSRALTSSENGSIVVSDDGSGNNGYVAINKTNVNTHDTYTIKEINTADSEYVGIINPISLELTKGLDASGDNYMVTNAQITYNGSTTESMPINTTTKSANKTIYVNKIGGGTLAVNIVAKPDGTITVKAENIKKTGQYTLQILKLDENRAQINGIKFNVSGESSVLETGTNGKTSAITKVINKENCHTIDSYTITELPDSQGRIVELKNPIVLNVSKTENPREYKVKTINIVEANTGNISDEVDSNETATLTDVELNDDTGRTVTVSANFSNEGNILVTVENKQKISKINLKIKKVDAETGKGLNGVSFRARDEQLINHDGTTANIMAGSVVFESGVAYLERDKEVTSARSYKYVITETAVPAAETDLIQLTDYALALEFNTVYDATKKEFVIDRDSVKVTPQAIATAFDAELHARQQEIAEKAANSVAVTDDGAEIALTVDNQRYKEYNFKIRKVDADTKAQMNDAIFTVYEDGNIVLDHTTLGAAGQFLINKGNVLPNTTHVYQIYEDAPAEGYRNIFENAYIEVTINVDSTGFLTASYDIKGASAEDIQKIKDIIYDYEEHGDEVLTTIDFLRITDNNTCELNIPNPKDTVTIDVKLQKHQLGNEYKRVNGAEFTTKRLEINTTNEFDDVTTAFDNETGVLPIGTVTTSKNRPTELLDHAEGVEVGKTLYYEITESRVPTNFESRFYKAIVKVSIGTDKAITSSILAVKVNASASWTAPGIAADDTNHLSTSVDGNTINVKWANTTRFVLSLTKRQYENEPVKDAQGNINWTGMQLLSGANFTITPDGRAPLMNNEDLPGTKVFVENNVYTDTIYRYVITEDSPATGFYNIFDKMNIVLTVGVASDGSINNTNTKIEVEVKTGETATEEEIKLAQDSVGLITTGQTVDVEIGNKKIMNTFNIKLLKVSTGTNNSRMVGIPNVKFNVMGSLRGTGSPGTIGEGYTDSEGYLTVTGVYPKDAEETFVITELEAPTGVTRIPSQILLYVDTTGIHETDTPEDIARMLNELVDRDHDGVPESSRFRTAISRPGAITGLKAEAIGGEVVVTIPNPTTEMKFNMFKKDEVSNLIRSDSDGVGAKFDVTYSNNNDVIVNDTLTDGLCNDYRIIGPESEYVYEIEEKEPKAGYVNVLEGYKLKVHVSTDINGHVEATSNFGKNGPTYYELEAIAGKSQPYTIDIIRDNDWIKLYTSQDGDTGTVNLDIVNPYGYVLELNKKDKNGSTKLNNAVITAKRIDNVDTTDFYYDDARQNFDAISTIIGSSNVSKTVTLNRSATTTSEELTILNNVGMIPRAETSQLWRIQETTVTAPYVNIFEDKYILVETYFRDGVLHVASHLEQDSSGHVDSYNYVIADSDGNNVTTEYADYLDVSASKVDGIWTLNVTVKDPSKVYVSLLKKKNGNDAEPLAGAELNFTAGLTTYSVSGGDYFSGNKEIEMYDGQLTSVQISENSAPKPYINVLKDKAIRYILRNNKGSVDIVQTMVIDRSTGTPVEVTGEERAELLSHITYEKTTTEDGFPVFNFVLSNPLELKLKLDKRDILGNHLTGTKIKVYSSHSGEHILDGDATLEFTEKDVTAHEVITYRIQELHAKEGAYINKFAEPVEIKVLMSDSGASIVSKKHAVRTAGGSSQMVDFDDLEYFDCGITPADISELPENGAQTLEIELTNPTQIEVDLLKQTAGANTQAVQGTVFKIESVDSHTATTDRDGKISYIEEISTPGRYKVRVFEQTVAGPKYVNVLENKYMEIEIDVSAKGEISTVYAYPNFFRMDDDNDYSNDVEISGDEYNKLRTYCLQDVDNTGEISKLIVTIKDPVKYDVEVDKAITDNTPLENARFEIYSVNGSIGTVTAYTDENGKILEHENMVNPGVYEYRVTELETPEAKYDNILDGNMMVAYVKVSEEGNISLVADASGTEFSNSTQSSQKYLVKKADGTAATAEDETLIRKFAGVRIERNTIDKVIFDIKNPVSTKFDIVKIQRNIDGTDTEALTNTEFTVVKNGGDVLMQNQVIDDSVELEEHNLTDGTAYYDIYETRTNPDGAYVNVLENRFIRVYTKLSADGQLDLTTRNGTPEQYYFELYEVPSYGNAVMLNRVEYANLYSYVSVWSEQRSDGIYQLNVRVMNPITMKVGVLKKQYGDGAENISNVDITVISPNTGTHNIRTTSSETELSEGNIKPGTYDFIVKENTNPSPRYVNILKDRYAKFNVTVSQTGELTCNSIKFYTDNGDDDYTNDVLIADRNIVANLERLVYANIDDSSVVQKITFVIENPVTLKFALHKTDLAGTSLEDAEFSVYKYIGDTLIPSRGMPNEETDANGEIVFEDGQIMKAGVYRYEVVEIKPAAEQYVNILDCYEDGSRYKVFVYVKLGLDGKTELVKDGEGHPFASNEEYKYTIVGITNPDEPIPDEVTKTVHKYLTVRRSSSAANKDEIDVRVKNSYKIDMDITKTTIKDGTEEPLAGTKFSANVDDYTIFTDVSATSNKEYTLQNISEGRHEFFITESQGVVNGGFINVLENRFVKVYTNISADGKVVITNRNGIADEEYFEIYEGDYRNPSNARMLSMADYSKIYGYVGVSAEKQSNGVYKLNLNVVNPERNYKVILNKKVFGEEDINIKNAQFLVASSVDNENHQLETDENGNLSFEEKRVPAGTYNYLFKETQSAGNEFVNVLENNYILVKLKVNQDGTVQIVDSNGRADGNENKFYIFDSTATTAIDPNTTVIDEFVNVAADNTKDTPELDFFVKNPELYSLKVVKKNVRSGEKLNNVEFTTTVYGPDNRPVDLVDAQNIETKDISKIRTANIDGVDGTILIPNILINKTGTYTYVFHEESTDGLFEYLYKSHAEDITMKVEISVEKDSAGRAIGYKVGQPTIVTGERYVDLEGTLTTLSKAQLTRAEITNEEIRGHYNLILNKLDSYTKSRLDGAEFRITATKNGEEYELYEDVDDLNVKNVVIPGNYTITNGRLNVPNIRITNPPYEVAADDGTLETYVIKLTETKAPDGYMLLDDPIEIEVTTAINGEYDDAEYVVKSVNLLSGENHGLVARPTYNSNEINIVAKNEYFDLALRKSITSVAYSDIDDAKITEAETEDRVPVVHEDDELFDLDPSVTTANYRHVKNHVRGYANQEVIYTLRVYNEGEIDGYAEEITDHLLEGLEFVNDEFNAARGWKLDSSDPTLRTVRTTFLSKDNNPNNDRFNPENNLIKALDASTGVIDYKEIEIKCKISEGVKARTVLTNIAEISMSKANDRTAETVDRDSHTTPGADIPQSSHDMESYKEDELTDNREDYVPGQEDDDDFEKIIVEEFDLALRKYITAINEDEILAEDEEEKYTDKVEWETDDETDNESEENVNIEDNNAIKFDREPRVNVHSLKEGSSTTASYEHTKVPLEVSTDDIVTYTIEVFNEGTVSGYASLIKDDIPEGVEFVTYKEGDGSINDIYRWKMVDENDEEVTDPKEAKYIVSDYLSRDNETEENGNLIRAFNFNDDTALDSRFVQVQFRVICKQDYPKIITNYAQISENKDDSGKDVIDRDSTPNEWIDEDDDQDVEHIRVTTMDLALRKFITGVIDAKSGKTQVVTTRIPEVDPTALIDESGTTAKYTHTKEPVLVHTNDVVVYTLRIYNEGSKNGYATQIKDDLPEGLVFLPDHEINKHYEWTLVDAKDKPVQRLEDAKYAVTNYLSKENETEDRQNLIKAFDYYDDENDEPAKRDTPKFKDIKIAFKVTEPQTSDRIIINEAQISEQTDENGEHKEDRDSTPNEWLDEDDEDIEKVRVQYFDLALRKWVTKAIVTQNGKEVVTETGHHAEDDPEDVVKVDLKKSKLNKVVVKFEYQIRITNEGEIEGYAKEIKDRIPEGLSFDPADNPTWSQVSENVIVTDQLKDTLLKPGESAEVKVVLTWINSGTNLGIKINVAEISKDFNEYGTPDIDSTPDNDIPGEDDIDDAPVMLAVKTGSESLIILTIATLVLALGVFEIFELRSKRDGSDWSKND